MTAPSCSTKAAQRAILQSSLPSLVVTPGSPLGHPFFDPTTGYTIEIKQCADLTGDGEDELVAAIGAGASGNIFNWAIFTPSAGRWTLVYKSLGPHVSDLRLGRDQVREVKPIFGPGDPLCCPTGHRVDTVAWNGHRFVVGRSQVKQPAYVDCGPLPVSPTSHVPAADVQVLKTSCSEAFDAARVYFQHTRYTFCGNKAPPRIPPSLRGIGEAWTDYCRRDQHIVVAAYGGGE